MSELDDLILEQKIPLQDATDFVLELRKLAVSDLWVHNAVRRAASGASTERLLDSAGKHMRGALGVVKDNAGDAAGHARKRLVAKNTALGAALERGASAATQVKAAAEQGFGGMEGYGDPTDDQDPNFDPGEPYPEEQVVDTNALISWLGQMVSHEFKLQQWYCYYAETMRGLERGAIAELFEELAEDELEDARYLLQRLSALAPKGAQIPVSPTPAPETDPNKILQIMLQEEQRAIVMLQHLRRLCGDEPMRYTVEQMIADEQTHADRLQQFLKQTPKTAQQKLAEAKEVVRQGLLRGEPSADAVVLQELALQAQQAAAENQALRQELQQTAEIAAQHASAADQAAASQQQLSEQLAMTQEESALNQQQAQEAMMEAQMGQQAAAREADAKARLAIRIQQLRQTLADLVSQDPVTEENVDAAPILTSMQQAAAQPVDPSTGAPLEESAQPQAAPQKEPKAPKEPEAGKVAAANSRTTRNKAREAAAEHGANVGTVVGGLTGALAARPGAKGLGSIIGMGLGNVAGRGLGRSAWDKKDYDREHRALRGVEMRRLERQERAGEKQASLVIEVDGKKKVDTDATLRRTGRLIAGGQDAPGGGTIPTMIGAHLGGAVGAMVGSALGAGPDSEGRGRRVVGTGLGALLGGALGKRFNHKGVGTMIGAVAGNEVGRALRKKEAGTADAARLLKSRALGAVKRFAAGAKSRAQETARDLGRSAAEGVTDSPGVQRALGELRQGLNDAGTKVRQGFQANAGLTLGTGALATGTSIYQGNKTRREIRKGRSHD